MRNLLFVLIAITSLSAKANSMTLLKCSNMPIAEHPILEVIQFDNGVRATVLKQDEADEGIIVESFHADNESIEKPAFKIFSINGNQYQLINYYNDFPAASDQWDLVRLGQTMSKKEKDLYPSANDLTTYSSGNEKQSSAFYDMNCR